MVLSVLIIIFFFTWLIPIIVVAKSSKVDGVEKLVWIMSILFVSWLAFIAYLIAAPVMKNSDQQI